jgi:hydroxymethylbilane synthase
MSDFVVGTRGSALARWQTDHVTASIAAARAAAGLAPVVVDVRVITTQGDVDMTERLAGRIEKGFFTAELESALLSAQIDWAVHSLKDLPTRLTTGLDVVAVLTRHRACDVLIARPQAVDVESARAARSLPLVPGARVGTSSLRRDAMLRAFAPDVVSQPLRGNVPTRVQKLHAGDHDAIVLAAAGVERLGLDLSAFAVFDLDPHRWQPAPGQGSVAVEARADDARVRALMAPLDDVGARTACERERAFLRVLEGGCSTPFGCYVAHGRAHLGLVHDGGWRSHVVALPADAAALDERFLHDTLARLQEGAPALQEITDDAPLWHRRA